MKKITPTTILYRYKMSKPVIHTFDRTIFSFELNPIENIKQQLIYSKLIDDTDKKNWSPKLVGGVDMTPSRVDQNECFVALSVFDYETKKLVAIFTMQCEITLPYTRGFLEFREAPAYYDLICKVKKNFKHLVPDVILVDGYGFWHDNFCGSASFLSLLIDIPCVGVAKQYLSIESKLHEDPQISHLQQEILSENLTKIMLTKAEMKEKAAKEISETKGQNFDVYLGNMKLGKAMNATGKNGDPIYISVGNGISLETASQIVLGFCNHRITEPIRTSDLYTRDIRDKWEKNQGF